MDKTKNGVRREIPTNKTLRATLNRLPRCVMEEEYNLPTYAKLALSAEKNAVTAEMVGENSE